MDALPTLNLFTLSLPAALLGAGLFGGLILLPPWLTPGPRVASDNRRLYWPRTGDEVREPADHA